MDIHNLVQIGCPLPKFLEKKNIYIYIKIYISAENVG